MAPVICSMVPSERAMVGVELGEMVALRSDAGSGSETSARTGDGRTIDGVRGGGMDSSTPSTYQVSSVSSWRCIAAGWAMLPKERAEGGVGCPNP